MKTLTQIADALEAKRAELKSALESVKGEDGQVDVEAAQSRMTEFEGLKSDIAGLETELKTAQALEALARDNDTEIKNMTQVQRTVALPAGQPESKSIAGQIMSSKAFQAMLKGETSAAKLNLDIDVKTLFSSTAGMAPQITRTGDIVETAIYPPTIVDAMDSIPTSQPTVRIQQETLTQTATEVGEGGAYPEAAISFADVDFACKKIGTILPVSDEELEDIDGLQNLLEGRLVFDVISRLNGQILNGAGTGDLVRGMLHTTNISTAECGTGALQLGSGSKSIFKAKQKLALAGVCNPNVLVMNPNDWAAVVTETASTSGVYMNTAAVSTDPVNKIWGMVVILTDKLTAGTFVMFDSRFVQLRPLRGIEVQIGYNGEDFGKGKKSIRADIRVALVVRRPQAIMKVTSFTA